MEDEAFALQLAFHRRRQRLRRSFLDKRGDITKRDIRFCIKAERRW